MNFPKKLKDFVALGSSNLLASIILGLFWLFLASLLTKTDYGQLGFFMAIANIAAAISLLGLRQTIMVYEPKNENVIPASVALVLITSIISAIVVFVFIQNFWVSILIASMCIYHLSAASLLSKRKYRIFSKYKFDYVLIYTLPLLPLAVHRQKEFPEYHHGKSIEPTNSYN